MKRDVNKILGITRTQDAANEAEAQAAQEALPQVLVHYPKPTMLSTVLVDVARWSQLNIILDPSLDRPLQIFATRKMPADEAFHVFTQSLESIGLRALRMEGGIVKIVTKSGIQKAC